MAGPRAMRSSYRLLRLAAVGLAAAIAAALAFPRTALANHAQRQHRDNIHALGHSPQGYLRRRGGRRATHQLGHRVLGRSGLQRQLQRLAGDRHLGPQHPEELAHPQCNGDQGDIVVWEDILVRSWNSKKSTPRTCLGTTVPARWEGVHVFDISDPVHPRLKASVELPCGSHTLTAAGTSNGNLIVYSNNSSSAGFTQLDRVALPRAKEDVLGKFMDVIAVRSMIHKTRASSTAWSSPGRQTLRSAPAAMTQG